MSHPREEHVGGTHPNKKIKNLGDQKFDRPKYFIRALQEHREVFSWL